MESGWYKFIENLNQSLDSKLGPIEQEISNQDQLIKKLSLSLSKISEAMQFKYGKLDLVKGSKKGNEDGQECTPKINKDEKEEPKEVLETEN